MRYLGFVLLALLWASCKEDGESGGNGYDVSLRLDKVAEDTYEFFFV